MHLLRGFERPATRLRVWFFARMTSSSRFSFDRVRRLSLSTSQSYWDLQSNIVFNKVEHYLAKICMLLYKHSYRAYNLIFYDGN